MTELDVTEDREKANRKSINGTMTNRKKLPDTEKPMVSLKDQIKKFTIKSLLGYHTVNIVGFGQRLGIFDYLYDKMNSGPGKILNPKVSFSMDELCKELELQPHFLEAWLQMAIETGIFQFQPNQTNSFIPCEYVIELLVDPDSGFFIRDLIEGFYYISFYQKEILEGFRGGSYLSWEELPTRIREVGSRMASRMGVKIERFFSRHYRKRKRKLKKGGNILDVGCGFGFTLQHWAKKYKRSSFIGLDIDEEAIEHSRGLLADHGEKVELHAIPVEDFASNSKSGEQCDKEGAFDVILLNQVLHEIKKNRSYHLQILNNLHNLLGEDGVLLIGEDMIPPLLNEDGENSRNMDFFAVSHKWLELIMDSRFYSEPEFIELLMESKFSRWEHIKNSGVKFWILFH